jgi:hypothetical protein
MTLFLNLVLVVFCLVYGCAIAFGIFYFYQLLRAAIRRLILPRATTGSNRQMSAADPRHPVLVITLPRQK